MKCPRCGLVHAPLEQVCRRCEIDLRTGEPAARSAVTIEADPAAASTLVRLRERLKALPRPAAPAAKLQVPEPHRAADKEPQSAPTKTKPAAFIAYAMSKKTGIPGVLSRFRLEPAVKNIICVQCSSEMAITRASGFPRSGPFALIALGVVLIAAALFFHLLLITGVASIILAILYLRAGRTSWKCPSCGLTIPRAP